MYYKIGTLAKRFGITTQSLRFYEAQGFLTPAREENSRTRRYQTRNLKWLTSIRRYHELGFGTEEIQQLFACEEPQKLRQMFEEKERETQARLMEVKKRLEALERQQEDLERIDRLLYRCEITASPRLWLLIDQVGQKLDESADMEQLTKAWMQELAFVYSASVVPREAVAGGREEMERKSGFCIEEEMARQLSLPEGEKVKKLFYESCLHTVTRLAEGESLMGHVTLYARENGWEITGDAVGRCLVKVGEWACQTQAVQPKAVYYEYWVPVRRVGRTEADLR